MRPIERCLGEVAEVMAGMTGLGDVGNYRYGVVQPNSFSQIVFWFRNTQRPHSDEGNAL